MKSQNDRTVLTVAGVFTQPGFHVWCGSVVRGEDGRYHLFYSRWPHACGFDAWVSHSEIARAVSDTPTGPYIFEEVVLPARGGLYWDGNCTHSVTVQKFGGQFYLYYMGNRGDGKAEPGAFNWIHRNNQRIGAAVADRPEGPWIRFEKPLIDVHDNPGAPDALMVSNPTVTDGSDGCYRMIYKAVGRREPLPFGGPVVHLAAIADSPLGPFIIRSKPLFEIPGAIFPAEDPFIWRRKEGYGLILKDMDRYYHSEPRSLVMFHSPDGVTWDAASPKLLTSRRLRMPDGHMVTFDRFERPQLYFEKGCNPLFIGAALQGDSTCICLIPLEVAL